MREVVGVAHNAGSSIASLELALSAGADIIELDLREHRGVLVSSHFPVVAIGDWTVFGNLDTQTAIELAADSDGLLLDLKQGDQPFLELVLALIDRIPGTETIYVSSPDLRSLVVLKSARPHLRPLLTINSDLVLTSIVATGPTPFLAGVSIQFGLLDEQVADWMCSRDLDAFAWPVDDAGDALNLIALGVTGITSGNPAILQALADD